MLRAGRMRRSSVEIDTGTPDFPILLSLSLACRLRAAQSSLFPGQRFCVIVPIDGMPAIEDTYDGFLRG